MLRLSIFILALAFFCACAPRAKVNASSTNDEAAQISSLFEGREGCFMVYDMNTHKTVFTHNEKRCAERLPPCSTFKVPLAVMAFDARVLKDENTIFKWDGKDKGMEEWNHDHTAASWMKNSVVWYSQRITPKLGKKKLAGYLARFDYGNRDMSAGIKNFWLMSSLKTPLKISAEEQVQFWDRFWRDELALSARATELTKKITFVENSPNGFALNGKTGSGMGDASHDMLGWYVGHIGKGDHQYVFATNYSAPYDPSYKGFPGWTAREISKRALAILGLW